MKQLRLRYRPEALNDLLNITMYYSESSIPDGVSIRFLQAFRKTLHQIRIFPGVGRAYPTSDSTLSGLRVIPLDVFSQYLLFYLVEPGAIRVVRILHGSRDIHALLESTP